MSRIFCTALIFYSYFSSSIFLWSFNFPTITWELLPLNSSFIPDEICNVRESMLFLYFLLYSCPIYLNELLEGILPLFEVLRAFKLVWKLEYLLMEIPAYSGSIKDFSCEKSSSLMLLIFDRWVNVFYYRTWTWYEDFYYDKELFWLSSSSEFLSLLKRLMVCDLF